MNELIFLAQTLVIASSCLVALRLGKEALVALIGLLCVLSNVFVIKQITIFGLQATAADAFSVGALLGLQLLQEYYGKIITKKTIWICFFCLILYTAISQIHLLYTPSVWDSAQPHFYAILRFAPRITIASLTVYLFVQHLNRYFYDKLKIKLDNRYLLARNYFLMTVSQLIDTILFGFLGLYGIVNNVTQVIIVSYAIKLLAILIVAPFVTLSKKMYQPR